MEKQNNNLNSSNNEICFENENKKKKNYELNEDLKNCFDFISKKFKEFTSSCFEDLNNQNSEQDLKNQLTNLTNQSEKIQKKIDIIQEKILIKEKKKIVKKYDFIVIDKEQINKDKK